MSQASNSKQTGQVGTSHHRTTLALQSFRSKLAVRIASRSPKMHEGVPVFVPESSRSGDGEQSHAMSVAENGRAHASRANSHLNNVADHLRCAECHNLGQQVGEARLGGITLAQRQNDAIHSLKMLIREASSTLETLLNSQDQLDYTHRGLDDRLVQLTASCPGCIILSSGITRPAQTADLTDETQLRQRLSEMSGGIAAVSKSTASDALSTTTLETIDKWVEKAKQAAGRMASQRSQAQSQLSALEATVTHRQAPFHPASKHGWLTRPDLAVSGNGSSCSTQQTDGGLPRRMSMDMNMLRREREWEKPEQGQEMSSTAVKSQSTALVTKGTERGGQDKSQSKQALLMKPSDFRMPPPNWMGGR